MKIAVAGCAHGELEKIYQSVQALEAQNQVKIDLLLCCGDFQSVRNPSDLSCMHVKEKYRDLGSFYKYYSGQAEAPYLTIFIGGNHEASNYLSELPYGGWVAPKIWYMGLAGVVKYGNLRIAGVSGIFKHHDYLKGRFERPPYDQSSVISVYHYRNIEIFRLKQLPNADIFLSHDWPRGIHAFGDEQALIRRKWHFKEEIEQDKLGSQPLRDIMEKLRPNYWFAAHLHVKFSAIYANESDSSDRKITKFLALDKCLPRRQFLQIVDVTKGTPEYSDDTSNTCRLEYDKDWLCILKSTDHLMKCSAATTYMPGPGYDERFDFTPNKSEIEEIEKLFDNNFVIPDNFCRTASPYDPNITSPNHTKAVLYMNRQTTDFCHKLGVKIVYRGFPHSDEVVFLNQKNMSCKLIEKSQLSRSDFSLPPPSVSSTSDLFIIDKNPDEVSIDDDNYNGNGDSSFELDDETKKDRIATDSEELDKAEASSNDLVNQTEESQHTKNVRTLKRRNADIYQNTND